MESMKVGTIQQTSNDQSGSLTVGPPQTDSSTIQNSASARTCMLNVDLLSAQFIVLYFIVFIHLYSASHSMSLSEALPPSTLILRRS